MSNREVYYSTEKSIDNTGTALDLVNRLGDFVKVNTWDKGLDWSRPANELRMVFKNHRAAVEHFGQDIVGLGLLESKIEHYAWLADGGMFVYHPPVSVVYRPKHIVTVKYKSVTVFKAYAHETAKTWRLSNYRSVPYIGTGSYYSVINKNDATVFVYDNIDEALVKTEALLDKLEENAKATWAAQQRSIEEGRLAIAAVRKVGPDEVAKRIAAEMFS